MNYPPGTSETDPAAPWNQETEPCDDCGEESDLCIESQWMGCPDEYLCDECNGHRLQDKRQEETEQA